MWIDGAFEQATTALINNSVAGKTLAANGSIYSSGNTINANNWVALANRNPHCVSRSNPTTTVITPDRLFAVQADHNPASSATWVGSDGAVYSRTIVKHYFIGNDIRVVKLNEALPETVGYAVLPPATLEEFLPNIRGGIPNLCLDQEKKALVSDLYRLDNGAMFQCPSDAQRALFHEDKISGDSGSPAFLLHPNGQLVLVTLWHWLGPGWGPAYHDYAGAISSWITSEGGAAPVVADLSIGTLMVQGTPADDVITISQSGTQFTVTLNGTPQVITSVDISSIKVLGDDGNDLILIDSSVTKPTTLVGGNGNDTLAGGNGNDSLAGDAGNDSLGGGGANDYLDGGDGNDILNGGMGADLMIGGNGDDRYAMDGAGYGPDTINETGGGIDTLDFSSAVANINVNLNQDTRLVAGPLTVNGSAGTAAQIENVIGGSGADTIVGNALNNSITGGAGSDTIYGGDGNDTIAGGAGNDTIYGGPSADVIYGDADDDLVWAGSDNDSIYGGDGNDILVGEIGDDSIEGGPGNDTIAGNTGNDLIRGQAGWDWMLGGIGNDTIYGGSGSDRAQGDGGIDLLYGDDPAIANEGAGDQLIGGDGDDTLYGGRGNDSLWGNASNDSLLGEDGNDQLWGGPGNDSLDGGADNDILLGEYGNDWIYSSNDSALDTIRGDASFDYFQCDLQDVILESIEEITLV